jgi:tetratricopeptide (TPR) repeat protein
LVPGFQAKAAGFPAAFVVVRTWRKLRFDVTQGHQDPMSEKIPMAGVSAAIANAARLLDEQPALAARQARELLKVVPGHPGIVLLLGMAANAERDFEHALAVLEPLVRVQPAMAKGWLELAVARLGLGQSKLAHDALRRAVALQPHLPCAWLTLAELLGAGGDANGANEAYLEHLRQSAHDPELMAAAAALERNAAMEADERLQKRLRHQPGDIAAMRMLAELRLRQVRNEDALHLLDLVLERAPGFDIARQNRAVVLNRLNRHAEALAEIDRLLDRAPGNHVLRNMKAVILGKLGDFDGAITAYEQVLSSEPGQADVWINYGNALKTAGRTADAVAAYRRCVEIRPAFGEAWWSLSNLKTVRFDQADVASMRGQLARSSLGDGARLHLEFALGKAMEDAGEYEMAFGHYARANAIRRRQVPYDAEKNASQHKEAQAAHTRDFFASRVGAGSQATDPIFVVGMPRSGSTLVEQILASHPLVEGTMELPAIIAIAQDLERRDGGSDCSYHGALASLNYDELAALGAHYLRRTQVQRKLGRPFFIDKMPNNFAHIGLIHLMFPNAKIVDVRRHPMACCFSNFKQHFARGQAFSYDLGDLGRFYVDYVALMSHYDEVLPGRVHRVIYEQLVDDTEGQVRALLDYCGLEFDARCLRFFENDRAVRTASSEQVRRPIYRDGLDQWHRFEPWLGPLKTALAPVLIGAPEHAGERWRGQRLPPEIA